MGLSKQAFEISGMNPLWQCVALIERSSSRSQHFITESLVKGRLLGRGQGRFSTSLSSTLNGSARIRWAWRHQSLASLHAVVYIGDENRFFLEFET